MYPPRRHCTARRHLLAGLLTTLAAVAAGAADAPAPSGLALSGDGTRVIDQRSGLTWPRCAEGMQWNGKTCAGEPLLMNHAEAIAWAAARAKAEGLRWRLPRAADLRRLVNKSADPPGLDRVLFPAAPPDWHWAVNASVDTAGVNQYDYGNIARGRTNENANRMAFLHGWAVNP
jgi:hypothetical protein